MQPSPPILKPGGVVRCDPRPPLQRGLPAAVVVMLVLVLVTGCGAGSAADPSAACGGADVHQAAGYYPDLEARLPAELDGARPARIDSGRYCSAKTLGSLYEAGIREEQFAGAAWPSGSDAGLTLVVYRAAGLTPLAVAEAFKLGAERARKVQGIEQSEPVIGGRQGYRIDLFNADSRQAVIVWPSRDGSVVQAVLADDVPEERIQAGIAAFGD